MKKKLNEKAIMNELQGESSFFPYAENTQEEEPTRTLRNGNDDAPVEAQGSKALNQDTEKPRYHDTTIPVHDDTLVEGIRKAVRQLGKEAATYRFTQEEKKALSNVVFQYKNKSIRTSENEITRIAITFLLEEFRLHGKQSILARVLERLNS